MPKRPKALTDVAIGKIKPSTKRREISDLYAPGLSLRIGRRAKTWTFTWRFAGAGDVSPITGLPMCGPQHRMTLGTWPIMGVAAARDVALAHATAVAGGKDPREATSTDDSFRALAAAFMAAKDKTVRHNSSLAIRNSLERHVLPAWKDLSVTDIDVQRLNQLVAKVTADVGATTGEVARKWSRAVFTWAVDTGLLASHPLAGVARKPRTSNGQAGRALTDACIRDIWHAAHDCPVIRLLLLTGARRSEWSDAMWPEINREHRTLIVPAERYKTKITWILPLTQTAWDIVERLPEHGGRLFPGGDPVDSALDKVRARCPNIEHWSPHDLRRTVSTRLAMLGVRDEVSEAVLGHVKPGVRKSYNMYAYAAEKRAALELYEAHVMGLVGTNQ